MCKITYFLPPYPTSPLAKLLSAIELLEASGCGDTTLLLLAAIAESTLWSDECYERFLDTGYKAAIELYDAATQNADFDEVQKDPNNPRNWKGYLR